MFSAVRVTGSMRYGSASASVTPVVAPHRGMIVIQEPVQPTITGPAGPSGPPTPRRRGGIRTALLIVIGVALAIPVIAITATPRATPTLSAGASGSPEESGDHDTGAKKDKGLKAGKGLGLGRGNGDGNGGWKGNGNARGPITIRAISGSQLSLSTEDGWTRTIVVTDSTVITKGGQPIAVGDLHVGDQIRFAQKRNADGTYAITAIAVPVPTAGGEVTAVDASTITVKGRAGVTRVITVTSATIYRLGNTPGSKSDVKVGTHVVAQGTATADSFTATRVRVALPAVAGEVAAKTVDTITIKRRDGSTTLIHVTDKTTYEVRGKDAAGLADVAVGDRVEAEGVMRADGSMDAAAIEGGPKKAKGPKSSAAPGTGTEPD
jgi:hypothetical protein